MNIIFTINMYRKQGNKFFTQKNYTKAIEQYNLGIENKEEDLCIILSNRALSYYYLEDYPLSLKDCIKICKINNNWYKGWFRLSQTLEKMDKKEESKKAYKRYKELELDSQKEKLIITEKTKVLNSVLMEKLMKDNDIKNIADTLIKNDKIMSKLMNNDFKNKIMQNPDILNNPMSLMKDKNFQEIFSETMKILQEKEKEI
tara:strand:+ start:733 stop:1335 length:603 start_codon:yes stop_codon:yes gene_type:complete